MNTYSSRGTKHTAEKGNPGKSTSNPMQLLKTAGSTNPMPLLREEAAQLASKEEEKLQLKADTTQLKDPLEEELPRQMKSTTAQLVGGGPEEEEPLQMKRVVQKKENNTGLPDNLKSGVENLSGLSMDDVKVHYNSSQPAQLNALAYAQGTDIHVAPGQEQHLPHEAWHVAQQKQGRVQPTMQMKDTAINDDVHLEHEADVMGAKALETKP